MTVGESADWMEGRSDPVDSRYGCFLPDLTGFTGQYRPFRPPDPYTNRRDGGLASLIA